MTTEPRAVIWDMDGTLIDSSETHFRSWNEIFAAEGIAAVDQPLFDTWFGRRNDEILREHLGVNATDDRVLHIGQTKEALYREALARDGVTVLPGAEALLDELVADGWLMAIGSSAPIENLSLILDMSGLALHFDAVVGKDDVRNGKPDPEVFLTAADRLGVAPARAIVVEDAAAGVLAGQRGGFRTIGVGSAHASLGAMRSARSLTDLDAAAFAVLLAEPLPER